MDDIESLALLLRSPQARAMLAKSSEALQDKYGMDDSSIEFVLSLDQEQIEEQAESLLRKRLFEIRFYAPSTLASLGDQTMHLFKSTVSEYWPAGGRRHMLDAKQFLEHLVDCGQSVDYRELNRINFQCEKKRFGVYLLRRGFCHGSGLHIIWRIKSGYQDCWYCLRNK